MFQHELIEMKVYPSLSEATSSPIIQFTLYLIADLFLRIKVSSLLKCLCSLTNSFTELWYCVSPHEASVPHDELYTTGKLGANTAIWLAVLMWEWGVCPLLHHATVEVQYK